MRSLIFSLLVIFFVACGSDNDVKSSDNDVIHTGVGKVVGDPIKNDADSSVTVMIEIDYRYYGHRKSKRFIPAIAPASAKIIHGDSVTYVEYRTKRLVKSVWRP